MKLSDKIQFLRKQFDYSQELLAEKCNVSRQAISKWESDIALPELDKLITLSNLFGISIDVLLKDELDIDSVVSNNSCHRNIINTSRGYYEGLIIKESLSDENVLDIININKVELWKTTDYPKYWTALFFTSSDLDLPNKLSKVLISDKDDGNWFADFKHGNIKYIVFKDKVLKYEIGNEKQKELVADECRKLGILDISNISE